MNYLIGYYLSGKSKSMLIGGLLTTKYAYSKDEIKMEEFSKGMDFYEQLYERFLNSNSFKSSTSRIRFINKKYAPAVISVFYDYFMANEWPKDYENQSFEEAMADFNTHIRSNKLLLPERAKKKFGRIRKFDIFKNLKSMNGMLRFYIHLNRSLAYNLVMQNALVDFTENHNGFKEDFEEFMNDLKINPIELPNSSDSKATFRNELKAVFIK